MNDEIRARLNKLVESGKISEEERKELEKLIFSEGKTETHKVADDYRLIKIKGTIATDVEIVGEEGREIKIVEGSDLFSIREEGNTVEIIPTSHSMRNSRNGVNFHFLFNGSFSRSNHLSLIVPKKSNINIKVVSGDISITNIEGDVSAKSVSGDLGLSNVNGKITLISLSGDIECREVNGNATIETKSGDISLNSCILRGNLKTYSGDITLLESEASNLEMTVYSGDVTLRDVSVRASIFIKSIFGDVSLGLKDCNCRIEAETMSGEIDASLMGKNYHVEDEAVFIDESNNIKRESKIYGSKFIWDNDDIPVGIKTKKGDISIKII